MATSETISNLLSTIQQLGSECKDTYAHSRRLALSMALRLVDLVHSLDISPSDRGRVCLKADLRKALYQKGTSRPEVASVFKTMSETMRKCLDICSLISGYRLGIVIHMAAEEDEKEGSEWVERLVDLRQRHINQIVLENVSSEERFAMMKRLLTEGITKVLASKKRTTSHLTVHPRETRHRTTTDETRDEINHETNHEKEEIRNPRKRVRLGSEEDKPRALSRAVLRTALHSTDLLEDYCRDEGLVPDEDEVWERLDRWLEGLDD